MSKENLQSMTKTEVVAKAKELGITRYRQGKLLPKEELIEAILKAENGDVGDATEEQAPAKSAENEPKPEQQEVENKDGLTDEERRERHNQYVENVKVGTLVAFQTGPNKAKSAMVVKRSTKNRKLKVETKYGKQFIISFDDVIWVHTNKRWPKGVYNMLKGMVSKDEGTDQDNR